MRRFGDDQTAATSPSPSPPFKKRRAALRLLIVPPTLLALWWAVSLTAGNRWNNDAPGMALALQGNNAIAQAQVAGDLLKRPNPTVVDIRRTEALAHESLQRHGLNPVALRTLGLVSTLQGNEARARRLLGLAERFSRRDVQTQMLLIEFRVSANDIPGALRHYDRALRVSRTAAGVLLPVLVSAAADPEVRQHLRPVLAARPEWLPLFMDELGRQKLAPAVLLDLANMIGLRPAARQDVELTRQMVSHMIRRKGYGEARTLLGIEPGHEQVRNGGFEGANLFPPFDWAFQNQGGWTALPSRVLGEGVQLQIEANYAAGGIVAQQMLALKPGEYSLRFRAGGAPAAPGEHPTIGIWCYANRKEHRLVSIPIKDGSVPQHQEAVFNVPASSCAQQWIRVAGPPTSGRQEHWIDDVSVALR